jgi:hypothetical protein
MVDRLSGPDADAGQNPDSDPLRPNVFIATPMYGGVATGVYVGSMLKLPAVFLRNGVDSVYACTTNDSLVPNVRNVLTHQFLESQATHLMWIDADIGFYPIDIISMLIADEDIVCGIYPKKEIDWTRVARAVKAGVPPEELHNHAGAFAIRPLEGSADSSDTEIDELFEIEAGGTGFMLVKRGVFEALSDDVADYTPAGVQMIKEFYATDIEPATGHLVGEDYRFCRLARSRGFKIYAAPWVRLGHAGTYVFDRRFDPNGLKLSEISAT